jgi:hypothetical protein
MDILVAPASSLESVRSAITSKLKFVEGTNGRIYSEEKPVAQVIYTADDKTLTFVYKNLYTKGGKYKGKTITELWSGTSVINNQQDKAPWAENTTVKTNAQAVVFDPSFDVVRPTSTSMWFNNKSDLEDFTGLGSVYTAVEDGHRGVKGTVLNAIEEYGIKADVIYACGPSPMLRAIKAYAAASSVTAWVSMEERMACGVGACLGCVVRTEHTDAHSNVRNRRVCADGPVFNASEVII